MNDNNNTESTILGQIKLVGVEEEAFESDNTLDSIELLPSADEILNNIDNLVNENKNENENEDENLNDPDYEPSDNESTDEDTIIDDYLSDEEENFEKELVENDCEKYCSLLEDLIKKYHRINDLILRRKKVLRLRHGYAFTYYNHDLKRVYFNDPVLIRANQWLEMLKKRLIFGLEHFNDTFLFNLTFNDRFGTPLILHSKHHQKNFRHRIINFLSRCRTKKYNIDRVVSFITVLISSFHVLKAGLMNPDVNHDESGIENVNPNIIIIE